MDLASGLSAAGQAIEIAKALRSVEKSYSAVELKSQVVDLMDKLLDVKSSLQDAQSELQDRDAKIAALRKAAKRCEETMRFRGFRMLPSAKREGSPQGLPFCLRCDEVDGEMISTVSNPNGMGAMCPECKSVYTQAPHYLWDDEA